MRHSAVRSRVTLERVRLAMRCGGAVAFRVAGRVIVPAVPNRSLLGDSAYIRSVIEEIDGPVLLAGHSYGAP